MKARLKTTATSHPLFEGHVQIPTSRVSSTLVRFHGCGPLVGAGDAFEHSRVPFLKFNSCVVQDELLLKPL